MHSFLKTFYNINANVRLAVIAVVLFLQENASRNRPEHSKCHLQIVWTTCIWLFKISISQNMRQTWAFMSNVPAFIYKLKVAKHFTLFKYRHRMSHGFESGAAVWWICSDFSSTGSVDFQESKRFFMCPDCAVATSVIAFFIPYWKRWYRQGI